MKIGYARVSTDEQNLDLQIAALKKVGCEKIYSEKISAVHPFKPELEDLLKYARSGDILVIWKLDRLGRNLKDLIEFSCRLKDLDIQFQSVTENIDTSSVAGEMFFHMMATFAEFERNILLQRTKAGMEAAKKKGKIFGRPPSLNPDQKAEILKQHREGKTVKDLASLFNVSIHTVYRLIKENP